MIGHSARPVAPGDDLPGQIRQTPGGVALNIARSLARLGHGVALLSAIGRDMAGNTLAAQAQAEGIDISLLHRPETRPTDRYMAIEGACGLLAAIADSSTLEACSSELLSPLRDGRLAGWRGTIVLDSGLRDDQLAQLAQSSWTHATDLRLTSAAPAKAARLAPFLHRGNAVFYLNLGEASALLAQDFPDSHSAALALVSAGAARAIVTDGPRAATDADAAASLSRTPPLRDLRRVTGAGDMFMAHHIDAELRAIPRADALAAALDAAACHISTSDT